MILSIQCRLFFDDDKNKVKIQKCSGALLMIFRTGSVLIVEKCNMIVLNKCICLLKIY